MASRTKHPELPGHIEIGSERHGRWIACEAFNERITLDAECLVELHQMAEEHGHRLAQLCAGFEICAATLENDGEDVKWRGRVYELMTLLCDTAANWRDDYRLEGALLKLSRELPEKGGEADGAE